MVKYFSSCDTGLDIVLNYWLFWDLKAENQVKIQGINPEVVYALVVLDSFNNIREEFKQDS